MQVSHSRIETFKQCNYKFKLKYIDGLKTLPNYDANNALIIGTALHTGIEKDVKTAIDDYFNYYPIITDLNIEEAIKLENIIKKCKSILPVGEYERKIENPEFIGFIDLLVEVEPGVFDLYDFKYSNNVKNYLESGQLHEYKFYFEKTTGKKIRKMFFLFAPKTQIKLKKTETLDQFRLRLKKELDLKEPRLIEVKYDINKVRDFLRRAYSCKTATKFIKSPSRLCEWCEYKDFCQNGDDFMILPKNQRRNNLENCYKKIWFYGLPFSGKTYLANKFPDVLMLNTDGNVKFIDAPCVQIKDIVELNGRLTKRTFAWDVFKDAIAELEKKDNDFKTVVVDLLEDTYEHCRVWCYNHLGIEHESDNSFKAWDFVRTEFLTVIKRLMNLDYNIILISHEDSSKDITKKTGDKITAIKPNVNEKTALKIAGMVDIVGRIVNDEGKRSISFKSNEVIFGGGRLNLQKLEIPCEFEELMSIYKDVKINEPGRQENKAADVPETKDRFFKNDEGKVFILPGDVTFNDVGEDPEKCVEITETDYKNNIDAEAEKINVDRLGDHWVNPPEVTLNTPTNTETTTDAPRRVRRVRNTQ